MNKNCNRTKGRKNTYSPWRELDSFARTDRNSFTITFASKLRPYRVHLLTNRHSRGHGGPHRRRLNKTSLCIITKRLIKLCSSTVRTSKTLLLSFNGHSGMGQATITPPPCHADNQTECCPSRVSISCCPDSSILPPKRKTENFPRRSRLDTNFPQVSFGSVQ